MPLGFGFLGGPDTFHPIGFLVLYDTFINYGLFLFLVYDTLRHYGLLSLFDTTHKNTTALLISQ